ncbi:MAG: bifunctional tRNA (5-methylaminomethyl-2-thiouridine)(34)-methyltransferase MnmD/FAD-dependent 5-carboxymethylaminomethyl-2-thiouridine(34) oxidoreductase MnmC [Gammaproteobacteria bacterium]|nr:bifunctional tRNA (5-methylaminomethyl-2-thiouridine)(34)-methyltransferase MnmD/FAD-dependent 5-carboxymethylaminomethyl-2-thiouridine(34) oxidoreductase MnmC [Gammaproteobacteria bacterium]
MKKIPERRIKNIANAQIDWREQTPVSCHYDDIYYSTEDGVAETDYVFLKQNNLPAAWLNQQNFSILETGFGSGLNFYCTLDLWFKTADENACLTYISVEKYPLTINDMQKQLQIWPQYRDFIQQVVDVYPPMLSGFHSCSLFSGRIKLLLLFGDASEQFSGLMASADACFLDGFAPSKNKSMWTDDLFRQLPRLMKPAATISTFTAAGDVRRGLQQAGFEMKKTPAFGTKRHMLTGVLQQVAPVQLLKPWFQYPRFKPQSKQAVVIGAGIAGLLSAIALLENGWQVTVLEQSDSVASGASGNLAGVVMPRLDKQQNTDSRFYWQAFFLALRRIKQFDSAGIATGWQQSGVLQMAEDTPSYLADWPEGLISQLTPAQAKQFAGVEISGDALWLEQAGFITPQALCENLCKHYRQQIKFVFDTEVSALQKQATGWQLQTNDGDFSAAAVVICNAEKASQFAQTKKLMLQPVRGQVSYLQSALAGKLKTVICDKGYGIPVDGQQLLIGASFKRGDSGREISAEDHLLNLQQFNNSLAQSEHLSKDGCIETEAGNSPATVSNTGPDSGRASTRAMTADRLPLVGAVPDMACYQKDYAELSRGKPASGYPAASYHNGLFINAGHGSRGLTTGFLSAEIIAALVSDQALPVDAETLCRLHPGRFEIKRLQSGKHS